MCIRDRLIRFRDGSLDGLKYMIMGDAPAEVAGERLLHLPGRRPGVLIKERPRGHQDAGSAETALKSVVLNETLLKGVKGTGGAVGQTLHGLYLGPIALHREKHAGKNRATIHDHGATATSPPVARHLGARQAQRLTKRMGCLLYTSPSPRDGLL